MDVLYLLSYGSIQYVSDPLYIKMAPQVRFELTTTRLTAEGSTTELLRINVKISNVLLSQVMTTYYHRR